MWPCFREQLHESNWTCPWNSMQFESPPWWLAHLGDELSETSNLHSLLIQIPMIVPDRPPRMHDRTKFGSVKAMLAISTTVTCWLQKAINSEKRRDGQTRMKVFDVESVRDLAPATKGRVHENRASGVGKKPSVFTPTLSSPSTLPHACCEFTLSTNRWRWLVQSTNETSTAEKLKIIRGWVALLTETRSGSP